MRKTICSVEDFHNISQSFQHGQKYDIERYSTPCVQISVQGQESRHCKKSMSVVLSSLMLTLNNFLATNQYFIHLSTGSSDTYAISEITDILHNLLLVPDKL